MAPNGDGGLLRALRLIVVTDRGLAAPRALEDVVAAALEGGARAIQLRNKGEPPRELLALGRDLRLITRQSGALLFVNDRLDVALALEADGAHLGPEDVPVSAARKVVGEGFVLGCSCDDPAEARTLADEGADYLGCGAVYATSTKADAGDAIGLVGLRRVVVAVDVPVVAIGGITVERAREVAEAGAAGVAAVSAVMAARDPATACAAMLGAFGAG